MHPKQPSETLNWDLDPLGDSNWTSPHLCSVRPEQLYYTAKDVLRIPTKVVCVKVLRVLEGTLPRISRRR